MRNSRNTIALKRRRRTHQSPRSGKQNTLVLPFSKSPQQHSVKHQSRTGSSASAVIGLIKRQKHVRLKLAEGIALALEFKMGGELLRTVVVRQWEELGILGAIILLRAALTFLIQWEIKIERKNGDMTDLELHDIKTPLTNEIDNKKPRKLRKKSSQEDDANT